jgi:hypothetical protein
MEILPFTDPSNAGPSVPESRISPIPVPPLETFVVARQGPIIGFEMGVAERNRQRGVRMRGQITLNFRLPNGGRSRPRAARRGGSFRF